MRRLRTWLVGLLVAGSCGLCGLPIALADVRTDARREFRAGMHAVSEGRYDEGIAHLEVAYDILPHPNVLYNIALAHMYAGRAEEAIEFFERYKETAPASEVADVDAMIASLRETEEPPEPDGAGLESGGERDLATALETAAREVRRLADETQSESLRAQAGDLEARARAVREGLAVEPAPAGAEQRREAEAQAAQKVVAQVAQQQEVRKGLYEEEVVSASRFAQSPLDAPNATAIITAQDIRMTGMTNATELLRRVAGVEVNSVNPTHAEVSIRGLNRRTSNKVLLLVDGRPYRVDLLGTSWYNQMPVPVEALDRIEVIRGPASALYGADAFSGIINFVTIKPGQGRPFFKGAYGSHEQARGVSFFTGRSDKASYRASFAYDQANNASRIVGKNRVDVEPLTDNADTSRKQATAFAELRYQIAEGSEFILGGDAFFGFGTVQGLSRLTETKTFESAAFHTWSSITTPVGIRIGAWWDRTNANAGLAYLTPGAIDVVGTGTRQDMGDVDISWSGSVNVLLPQTITIGGGYRYKHFAWAWIAGEHSQHHLGAYLQDVITLAKPLTLQLGARLDRHPLLNTLQFSPRGSLVYRFASDQSLRASIGRAFRGPSFLESYAYFPNSTPLRGVTAYGIGNDELKPESIVSYELGYQNQTSDYFALEANVYYNQVKDLIQFTDINEFTLSDFAERRGLAGFDDDVEAFPLSTLSFTNERARYRQIGGELGIRFYPVQGLDVYANYSVHDTSPIDGARVDPTLAKEQQTSRHKVNSGVQYRARSGFDLSLDAFWFSQQVWVEQVTDRERGVHFETFSQPSFLMLNARVGWRLWDDRLDLGVVGTNLAFQDKRQHPFGQPLDTRVLGTAQVQF